MNKEFTPHDQAIALKELGFDEPCLGFYFDKEFELYESYDSIKYRYNNGIKAPLYQQAFRWFREKHGLHGSINQSLGIKGMFNWSVVDKHLNCIGSSPFYSYEESKLACLIKLIEICKKK